MGLCCQSHADIHMRTLTHTICWCENSEHACPFTLHSDPQTEDYTKDNPCVCLCVSLSACLSIHSSLHLTLRLCLSLLLPAAPDINVSLPSKNTCVDTNVPQCLFAAFSFSLANERSAHKVCLNDQHHVITFVTVSLLSAHNCYCQLQNYMAAKPLSFSLQQHQDAPFSSIFVKSNNTVLPHSTATACPSPLNTDLMIMQHLWYFANAFIASRDDAIMHQFHFVLLVRNVKNTCR